MPRRNNRAAERYQPLDLTPNDANRGMRFESRAHREQVLAARQRAARIAKGIDWSICLVPGCGEHLTGFENPRHPFPERRNHELALPMCTTHMIVVHKQVTATKPDGLLVEAATRLLERQQVIEKTIEDGQKQRRLAKQDGHIYFVRLNGLVKVGWSRFVDDRLRSYGPDVEVLAIYPGTRQDETNLHRQLRPALKVGREWYEDGKIIADFVAGAVAEHGEPKFFDSWTRPAEVIKPRRRSA